LPARVTHTDKTIQHIADPAGNLAELYRAQGKYDEAEPLYKGSLKIFEKAFGPKHPHKELIFCPVGNSI
jgi:tetratricopeptide (TPR) repeat protein